MQRPGGRKSLVLLVEVQGVRCGRNRMSGWGTRLRSEREGSYKPHTALEETGRSFGDFSHHGEWMLLWLIPALRSKRPPHTYKKLRHGETLQSDRLQRGHAGSPPGCF